MTQPAVPALVPSHPPFGLLESKLIWIQDRVLEESRKTYAVTVEDIPAWFIRGGHLILSMGGKVLEAGAGHWVFPRQGEGRVQTPPNSEILSLRFRLRWPNGEEAYRRRESLLLKAGEWPQLNATAEALLAGTDRRHFWFAERWEPAGGVDYFSMQAHFYAWLTAYCQVMEAHGQARSLPEERDAIALAARRALLAWDLAAPFSRSALSRQLGVGIQSVSRRFAAYFGTTPRGFLEQRKLEWAQQRLVQSEERVKGIAAELGFASLAQFTNWFHLRNQVSPREYRRLARERIG